MEIKAELKRPYSENQKMDFIVKYNHKKGYTINETDNTLQALGYTDGELAEKERERINLLSLTAADVERAIYKAKGMDFEDIITLVEQSNSVDEQNVTNSSALQPFNLSTPIDVKALKIELKANNFYRGNPYIDQVGALLGFTSDMLDRFFETNDYTHLIDNNKEILEDSEYADG